MGPLTQEDPIGIAGGLNLYGYAGGDPINYSDPFGLEGCRLDAKAFYCIAEMALSLLKTHGAGELRVCKEITA